ncbi:hypothetical protein SDC9_83455 [bioreactor metagenome]|uniref:Uncharacterized protein n=1 Tax=bioreactor metagenome TaxID=1076179 RepID=A0A644ZA52_9ZZZZ
MYDLLPHGQVAHQHPGLLQIGPQVVPFPRGQIVPVQHMQIFRVQAQRRFPLAADPDGVFPAMLPDHQVRLRIADVFPRGVTIARVRLQRADIGKNLPHTLLGHVILPGTFGHPVIHQMLQVLQNHPAGRFRIGCFLSHLQAQALVYVSGRNASGHKFLHGGKHALAHVLRHAVEAADGGQASDKISPLVEVSDDLPADCMLYGIQSAHE